MTTKFNMSRDINGFNGFGLKMTDTAYSATLATTTDTTLTIPSTIGIGKQGPATVAEWVAIIESDPGTSVWVALNATAGVPAGASFAATASALNPGAIDVLGGDVLHFYTSGTGVNVSVRLYSLS